VFPWEVGEDYHASSACPGMVPRGSRQEAPITTPFDGVPMQPFTKRIELVEGLREIALSAGETIMRIYASGTEVRTKADASPVTDADEQASAVILAHLVTLAPGVLVVCEETHEAEKPVASGEDFLLVDPLDGTKEFISKNGEFTVNVALIHGGEPVAGVVYAPAIERLFFGWRDEDGRGFAFEERKGGARTAIHVAPPSEEGVVVVASRSHRDPKTDEYLANMRVKSFTSAGSSLKFCLVATGEADLYPRLGRTMEWDTAAGQAVLQAAGGSVSRLDGAPLLYGKPGFENPFFVARGV
jgi:3'(2'), 5'-bisphosphate nucleotidase